MDLCYETMSYLHVCELVYHEYDMYRHFNHTMVPQPVRFCFEWYVVLRTGRYSEVLFLRTVFIPKDHFSEHAIHGNRGCFFLDVSYDFPKAIFVLFCVCVCFCLFVFVCFVFAFFLFCFCFCFFVSFFFFWFVFKHN